MPLYNVVKSIPRNPLRIVKNIAWRFPATTVNSRVIFIIGTPRSGTTLLKSILCGSSDAAYVEHETTAVFQYRDIFAYPFRGHPTDETQQILSASRDIIDFYQRFIEPILASKGASIFVDKLYRVDRFLIGMIAKHIPNSHFIYISRDGRDCYCSSLRHPHIPQRVSLTRFAKYYNKNELLRVKIFSAFEPKRYTHIKYEDLCRDPSSVVARICSSVGMSFEQRMLTPSSYSSTTTISSSMIHANLQNPIGVHSVSRFKAEMTPHDIAVFESYARQALQDLNYLA